jgi:hypothetical protein
MLERNWTSYRIFSSIPNNFFPKNVRVAIPKIYVYTFSFGSLLNQLFLKRIHYAKLNLETGDSGEIFSDSRDFYLAVDLSQARSLTIHQHIGPEYLDHQIQSSNDRQR